MIKRLNISRSPDITCLSLIIDISLPDIPNLQQHGLFCSSDIEIFCVITIVIVFKKSKSSFMSSYTITATLIIITAKYLDVSEARHHLHQPDNFVYGNTQPPTPAIFFKTNKKKTIQSCHNFQNLHMFFLYQDHKILMLLPESGTDGQ